MQVKIHAFGIARDILGGSSLSIEMPEQATVAQLKARLCQDFPSFEKLASLAVALNTEYATDSQIIAAGDEVVIIPPVSGG